MVELAKIARRHKAASGVRQPTSTLCVIGKARQSAQHVGYFLLHERIVLIHARAVNRHTLAVFAVQHNPCRVNPHLGPQAVTTQPVVLIFAGFEGLIKKTNPPGKG